MTEKNKIISWAILVMFMVTCFITGGCIYSLYRTALEEQKERLLEVVNSRAQLLESANKLIRGHSSQGNVDYSDSNFQGSFDILNALLDQSMGKGALHPKKNGMDKKSENSTSSPVLRFVLAETKKDTVNFLSSSDGKVMRSVPLKQIRHRPMGMALSGQSGTIIGDDHLGNAILAAYTPINSLQLGIVVKIFLNDIRGPFVRVGLYASLVSLFLVLVGSLIIRKTIAPLVVKMDSAKKEAEKAYKELKVTQTYIIGQEKKMAISTLAGGIAHEFNNILGSILGYADLVKDKLPAGSQAKDDIEEVLTSGYRAWELVKQMLAFSHQNDQELKPVEMHILVTETIKLLRDSIPESIEIHQSISSDSRAVIANSAQIQQLLTRLCTNAVQAMHQEGVLEIGLSEIDLSDENTLILPTIKSGKYLKLTVSDNGPGIDPSVKKRIFDPFFTTKEVGQGTGLGLYVVHGIVEKHKGLIRVDSEPGHGASFHIYLPVTEEKVVQDKQFIELLSIGQKSTTPNM